MANQTVHCCVVEIAGLGILIRGKSGSGKTSLAFGLVEASQRNGLNASLVADDRAFLTIGEEGITASVPSTLAGKFEQRGFGIVELPFKPSTRIGLIVELRDDRDIERMPEEKHCRLLDRALPLIEVPVRHEAASVRIVMAWLANRGHSRTPVSEQLASAAN